jgi:serine/threonine protein phosphatase PrpC
MPIDSTPWQTTGWHATSLRGPRRVNADATASYRDPATGRTAYVVADGVGDSERAATAARLAARTAAATAVTDGPRQAVLAAQRALLTVAPGRDDGDCVLVVAVPGEFSCDVAWVGDCRAYHSNGRILEQITVDHTVAEYYRARGMDVAPRMEHLVTTSIRTVEPDRIGTSRTGLAGGRLLLCSDGIHKSLSIRDIRTAIDQPLRPAQITDLLVGTALTDGGRDNATAMVIDHVASAAQPLAAA